MYVGYLLLRFKGFRSEILRDTLKRTHIFGRSWSLLGFTGFRRAGVHKQKNASDVKYDWFAARSFRSSFGAHGNKISILKGGRLFFTMA